MAIAPTPPDAFMREVDQELRKERVATFLSRYGWWVIAAVLLVLGAIGGVIWWQDRQRTAAGLEGERLLEVVEALDDRGAHAAAAPKIAELAQSDVEGYRAAGLFARAAVQVEAGNRVAAIATFRSIADDASLDDPYRQAALIRQTALEFDTLRPQIVIQRLGALARPGQAWFGSAGEMVGVAHLRMGRADLAGPLFAQIGRDESVPPSIRSRAIQMAGALGINAMPEANRGSAPAAPGAGADAPETKESAE